MYGRSSTGPLMRNTATTSRHCFADSSPPARYHRSLRNTVSSGDFTNSVSPIERTRTRWRRCHRRNSRNPWTQERHRFAAPGRARIAAESPPRPAHARPCSAASLPPAAFPATFGEAVRGNARQQWAMYQASASSASVAETNSRGTISSRGSEPQGRSLLLERLACAIEPARRQPLGRGARTGLANEVAALDQNGDIGPT